MRTARNRITENVACQARTCWRCGADSEGKKNQKDSPAIRSQPKRNAQKNQGRSPGSQFVANRLSSHS